MPTLGATRTSRCGASQAATPTDNKATPNTRAAATPVEPKPSPSSNSITRDGAASSATPIRISTIADAAWEAPQREALKGIKIPFRNFNNGDKNNVLHFTTLKHSLYCQTNQLNTLLPIIAVLKKIIKAAPDDPDIVYALVTLYAQQEKWSLALPYAKRLVELTQGANAPNRIFEEIKTKASLNSEKVN